ncbi:MAG: Eco57I restriction-modification methylase domain-containing protein [Leptospiraceae bacterium]|nr:Eco57I restriction-modification methylase domain-containing protein [Leptospiraceae bacterium]
MKNKKMKAYNHIINNQRIFESKLNVSYRKDFGVFFTNNIETVEKIIKIIDFEDKDLFSKKILEPSCGNGIFIIRILEKVFENIKDHYIAAKFIESCIYFVDIDKNMIESTKSNISNIFKQTFHKEYRGKFNGFIFDYTQRMKPKHDNSFANIMDVPLAKYLESFDYIIGNPPYVTLYGRRDKKKDENQRKYYLSRYSQFPDSLKNGKINYVMLFIEQSIDLLKKGGKLSFIIDLAFFETAYEHTRKFLLEKTKILSIEYNIKDFEVVSGQIIIQTQKNSVTHNEVCIVDAKNHSQIKVEQTNWYKPEDQYRFRFNTCSNRAKLIEKIKLKNCPSLKSLFPNKNLRTCVMLLDMENLFVFNKPETKFNGKIYPYYQGSKSLSSKYAVLKYNKFFHYNKDLQDEINDELKEELTIKGIKNKKRLGMGETIIYDKPKVYIRQSAKEILASYDDLPSSANNSLYIFSLRDSTEKSIQFLKFLCGFLNSKLITFYTQQTNIIRYSKGKQPQIKVSDLYSIPIPIDIVLQRRISQLVNSIYHNYNKRFDSIQQVDYLIFEYFELKEEEVSVILDSIDSF